MKDEDKYIVAVKDTSSGKILPGKILARYRKEEFAFRDWHKLAQREGCEYWHVGIFFQGKLIS